MPLPLLGMSTQLKRNIDQRKNAGRISSLKNRFQIEMKKLAKGVPSLDEIPEGVPKLRFVPNRGLFIFAKYNRTLYHSQLTEGSPDEDNT